jgi:hypothetical protein
MTELIFIFGLICVVIYFYLCFEVAVTAERLKRSVTFWFFMSFLITPFFAAIMVHCLGKNE